jgi:hypothetical protein
VESAGGRLLHDAGDVGYVVCHRIASFGGVAISSSTEIYDKRTATEFEDRVAVVIGCIRKAWDE